MCRKVNSRGDRESKDSQFAIIKRVEWERFTTKMRCKHRPEAGEGKRVAVARDEAGECHEGLGHIVGDFNNSGPPTLE